MSSPQEKRQKIIEKNLPKLVKALTGFNVSKNKSIIKKSRQLRKKNKTFHFPNRKTMIISIFVSHMHFPV